jgi:hypothetical protein
LSGRRFCEWEWIALLRTLNQMTDPEQRALAREMSEWRGHIDERGVQNARTLKVMGEDMTAIKECQVAQGKELVALKVKVGIGSALGGLIGAGIVAFATRGFGG